MENKIVKMGYGFVSDKVEDSYDVVFSMKIVAKIINKKGFGRNKLYELLRQNGYIEMNNFGIEKYILEEYFLDSATKRNLGGVHGYTNQILVTNKGLELIKKLVELS